jgi:hypothetical protein
MDEPESVAGSVQVNITVRSPGFAIARLTNV